MNHFKSVLLVCVTFLITVVVVLMYYSEQTRYMVYQNKDYLFVFDKKTAVLNYCNEEQCHVVRPFIPTATPEVLNSSLSNISSQAAVVIATDKLSKEQVAMNKPSANKKQYVVPQAEEQSQDGTNPNTREPVNINDQSEGSAMQQYNNQGQG